MKRFIEFVKKNKILVLAISSLTSICIIAIIACAIYLPEDVLTAKKDVIEIELGSKMSNDILFYLDTSELTKEQKNNIEKDGKLSLPDEKEYLKKTGTYKVKVTYKMFSVTKNVIVLDTVPPAFEVSDNLTVPLGTPYTEEDAKKAFKVNDVDEYTLTVDLGGYDGNKEGTYTIKAVAKDKSGNKTEYSFTITVSSGVTEIQTSQNTQEAVSTISKEVADKSTHVTETTKTENPSNGNSSTAGNTSSSNNSSSTGSTGSGSSSSGSSSSGNGTIYVKNVTISGDKEVYVGDTIFLTASVNPSNASNISYNWSSNNSNAVTEGQGFPTVGVRGERVGTSVITCNVNGVKATYTVTVKEKPTAPSLDFSGIKVHMVNPSKQYTHKTMSQMSLSQSGNNYSCTINLGSGGNGLVFLDNNGEKTAAGIYFEVDFSKWYCTTGYPQSYGQYLKNSLTYVFKDYSGNVLTVKLNVGNTNTDLETAWKIFNFA